jgi:hypothetical protein
VSRSHAPAGIRRGVLLTTVLALAFVPVATAGGTSKVIGHAVRLKGTKIFYLQGKAVTPNALFARVVPSPAQPVKVQWSVVCQKPNKADPAVHIAATGETGEISVTKATTVKLALPYARPPSCVATVYGTLTRDGDLVLHLVQT